MGVHFSGVQRLIKKGQKSDSFSAYFKHNFKSTTSCTYLRKCMDFNVVNHLNPIGAMKSFRKPNCNICMEERLTIPKNICDKRITLMNRNWEIYGA